MPADHIRGRVYRSTPMPPSPDSDTPHLRRLAQLNVEPTHAGQQHVHLWTYDSEHGEHVGVLLTAEQTEQLGIDLQIRASYLRGVRPPSGPEPDPVDPTEAEALIPEESSHGR